MFKFKPFENESQALSISELNIENRLNMVSVYGSVDITKDMNGLADPLELQRLINSIVHALKQPGLPYSIKLETPETVANPFSPHNESI